MANKPGSYPSDVGDEEWAFCVPYLTLMKEGAPQRKHSLRALFNALRWLVRAGCSWRLMPNDLPPWPAVQQQTQRWVCCCTAGQGGRSLGIRRQEQPARTSQRSALKSARKECLRCGAPSFISVR